LLLLATEAFLPAPVWVMLMFLLFSSIVVLQLLNYLFPYALLRC
jgi:hypothetical protein